MAIEGRSTIAIAWVLAAVTVAAGLGLRLLGSSDLYHQTQPRTVSYTTDILVSGRWILPLERGVVPATKPPLYNWVAAPVVAVLGHSSEVAHRMPSILSFFAIVVLTFHIAGRMIPGTSVAAPLAVVMLTGNYAMYKLGALARPDMLLTLWLSIAWWSATRVMLAESPSRREVMVFWLAVALAWITKGPAAIVPIVYALVGPRVVGGRWSLNRRFAWWWGLPASMAPFAAWLFAVYQIAPDHVLSTLWHDEVYSRVVGATDSDGTRGVPLILQTAFHMPLYYVLRFAPWSVLSIVAMIHLWRRDRTGNLNWHVITPHRPGGGAWMHAAAAWIVIVLVVFTLSAGKRADYIASAFPPGAVLVAWWCVIAPIRRSIALRLAPAAALACIGLFAVVDSRESHAPQPGYGNAIRSFIRQAETAIDANPAPVAFWNIGASHIMAALGASEADGFESVRLAVRKHDAFWLVAGDHGDEGGPNVESLALLDRFRLTATPAARLALPRSTWFPGRMTLYRVERGAAEP
jgi:4-amino-4-deoxy-L-arabinose transferase-like glycosyltransferase